MRTLCFRLIIAMFIGLSGPAVMAQRDYVENDSIYTEGTLVDRGTMLNNREIRFIRENSMQTEVFHPGELTEFGFRYGDIYVTKLVEDDKNTTTAYFLLEQVTGKAKLFVLKTKHGDRFFTEKNDKLMEFRKDGSFRITLSQVLNQCTDFENSFPLVKRNRASLSRIFSLYNSCYNGVFPTTRMGLLAGYGFTNFAAKDLSYNYVSMKGEWAPFVGAFIETPLGLSPRWFANFQIQYQRNNYSASVQFYNTRSDYQITTTAFNVPILFKYRGTAKKFRPYLIGGPAVSCLVQHQSKLEETTTTNQAVKKYDLDLDNISQFQLGASLGVGTEFSLNMKRSIGIETRYSAATGMRKDNNQLVSSLQFMCSVYF